MSKILLVLCGLNLVMLFMLLQRKTGSTDKTLRDEMSMNRKELSSQLKEVSDSLDKRIASVQQGQLESLRNLTEVVEKKLTHLQQDNSDKLEKMRATVDEKLQSTLEKRLGESFKMVSDRLEQVHKGLGEMQGLAVEVGSFKSLMTGIKTRGTWGEVQLESLLEQVFIKDHYEKQVTVSDRAREVVDFAIKLPDKSSEKGFIYLPIDAKFPLEDYQRLVSAQEAADPVLVDQAGKALASRIKLEAKSIKEKYIFPPATTDFAVLYVPTEGLYAEILRYPGLFESLQSDYRVTVAGPTTIAAILSSYQLGFRTLAIAEQTSHVWEMLTTIKGEFGKFGDLLEKTKEKLDQASRTIDTATTKSRTIEKKLSKMEQLESKTVELLED
jgi:DNA recombination protein RmuC